MSLSSYRLLIFDWDGTLMDSESRIIDCLASAIRDLELAEHPDCALSNVIGLSLTEAFLNLYPEATAEEVDNLILRYRHYYLQASQVPTPMFPGAVETLHQLRDAGYQLAVATGKGRTGLARVLEYTGLATLFDATRCSDETASKPDPEMVLQLLDELDVPAHQAVTAERLHKHGLVGMLHDITELPDWLAQLSGVAGEYRMEAVGDE
jgi:phosphoglycolate phosphatase